MQSEIEADVSKVKYEIRLHEGNFSEFESIINNIGLRLFWKEDQLKKEETKRKQKEKRNRKKALC